MKQLIIIISIIFTFNLKAQTTIGWDAGCSYDMNTDPNSLQQAIDDGMTDIRLTNENNANSILTDSFTSSNVKAGQSIRCYKVHMVKKLDLLVLGVAGINNIEASEHLFVKCQ